MKRARRSPGRTGSRRSRASSAIAGWTEGRAGRVAVILAGGSGTRLWPLATASRPKPFVPLFNGRSLFQDTYTRVARIFGVDRIVAVVGEEHLPWVRRQAPGLRHDRIIVEGEGRNTAASVALAALLVRARHGDAITVVFPADHTVSPFPDFRHAVLRGADIAARSGELVVFGVKPRAPTSGFGYIRPGRRLGVGGARRVARFVEKPSAGAAARMVRAGYLWNSGMFAWRPSAILGELRSLEPALAGPLEAWARARTRGGWSVPAATMRRVPRRPIDRVLERSRRMLVVPARFHWSDLGDWGVLASSLARDRGGRAVRGRLVPVDAPNSFAVNPGGLTVLVGVRNVVAVRTGSTMLVCHLDAVQSVRDAVARLGERAHGG